MITKRYPGTINLLRLQVETKVASRATTVQGEKVGLLQHIKFKLTQEIKPKHRKALIMRTSKELPEREILFRHLMEAYIDDKASMVYPYVPGAVYYRDIMREKAKLRETIRKNNSHASEVLYKKNKKTKRATKARTLVALRADLQRQLDENKEEERIMLVQELRHRENKRMEKAYKKVYGNDNSEMPSTHDTLSVLPSISQSGRHQGELAGNTLSVLPSIPQSERNQEELAGNTLSDINVDNNVSSNNNNRTTILQHNQKNGNSRDIGITVIVEDNEDVVEELQVPMSTNNAVAQGATDSILHNMVQTKASEQDLETKSNPEKEAIQGANSAGKVRAKSAESVSATSAGLVTPRADKLCFITETSTRGSYPVNSQTLQPISHCEPTSPNKEANIFPPPTPIPTPSGSAMRFLNPYLRRRLVLAYDNPTYRDWETSDNTLGHLEDRIKKFASQLGNGKDHVGVTEPLKRFEHGVSEVLS